ncbi:MAG: hypothetical protein JSS49_07200 [Planctomycetes bacterium]|nr:hypothetical protein [Planctomycetota bacterium]
MNDLQAFWCRLAVGFACVVLGANCPGQVQPAPNSIQNFNLSTGGTGLYRPGKWGLIRIGVRNPQDYDVDLLASTYFVGDPTLQYGRRMWIPPKSRLSTWHPLRMPALESPDQKLFELRSMVVVNSADGESMATNEFGAMQFDQGFRVAADESVTAVVADFGDQPAIDSPWSTTQDLVLAGRHDRSLRYNYVLLTDPLFPAGEELLESIDQLVIASDRLSTDVGGIAAIRRWVASGGRLWIMADTLSPEMLASLLGDEDTFLEVDRVDLNHVNMETGAWSQTKIPFERELERPVRFVRVIAENVDVDFLVNGWPAAFWKTYGEGRILVTTLGSDGWLSPRPKSQTDSTKSPTEFIPSGPLSQLAMEFFTSHSPQLIPHDLAESQVREMIGYSIPARSLVVGTLGGFTLLLLVLAVAFARRGRLELMGLAVPVLSVLAAGVLLVAGWNNRSTIPASVAMIQVVQGVPGTDEIRTSGLAGAFSKGSQPTDLSGTAGGWMVPEMSGLEGTTRRMVWSDIDSWSWQNLPTNPGLRTVEFQTAGRVAEAVEAVAEFDARGLHGRLVLPANLDPGDAVIATARGRMGVDLKADGTFVAAATGVLGNDQYLSASVLSDEQQRRSQLMSQILKPAPGITHSPVPLLLVWTRPWEAGMSLVGPDTVGSALVSVPLRWERPAAGSSVTIPAPFLPFREVTGPDGTLPTGIYNYRKGIWQERTGPSATWLGFSVPANLIPLDVKSATITFKVLGPLGRLAISTVEESRLKEWKVWDNPVGTLSYEITDPRALKLDSRGRIVLRVEVGNAADSPNISLTAPTTVPTSSGVMAPVTYWQFEDISLQLSAEVGKHVD